MAKIYSPDPQGEEFFKYLKDYCRDRPGIQVNYWGLYKPYGDKGWHYGIYATQTLAGATCPTCGTQFPSVETAGESGYIFKVKTTKEKKPRGKPPNYYWTPERVQPLVDLYEEGQTLEEIGSHYSLTRERVRQLLRSVGHKRAPQPNQRKTPARSREFLEYHLNRATSLSEVCQACQISAHSVVAWAKHHNLPIPSPAKFRQRRFLEKVQRSGDHWIWRGAFDHARRPRFLKTTATDYSYMNYIGDLPDDATARPVCGNQRCVNPEHLDLAQKGTHRERGTRKSR